MTDRWNSVSRDGRQFASARESFGMIWILAHWLAPVTATREDIESLIDKAMEKHQQGYEIGTGENTPW